MKHVFHYTIQSAEQGLTIGLLLRKKGYSRHIITHLKSTKHGILLNHTGVYTSHIVQAGDLVTVQLVEDASSEHIQPFPLPIDIFYEDSDIIIVNKSADMPVHPSQNNYQNTLANGIAYYFASQDQAYIFRCMNRLDRDTTGLLILAKHMLSAAVLSKMMKEREISRTYLALVEGCPPVRGTITAPIGRKPGSIIQRMVDYKHGESAVTHYQLIQSGKDCSLVQLHLETGRTHQIRIHMHSIGHPLLGDTLYHRETPLITRQALHSQQLIFPHPINKNIMKFTCPLPNDMRLM